MNFAVWAGLSCMRSPRTAPQQLQSFELYGTIWFHHCMPNHGQAVKEPRLNRVTLSTLLDTSLEAEVVLGGVVTIAFKLRV